jgi:hypothetical protein
MIEYKENGKFAYFNGLKFTKDDKTGYYLNSTTRNRLHRYVWEFYNGEIAKGNHIHHIDMDKSNNNINNLALLEKENHLSKHGKLRFENNSEWFNEFHEKGIEAAKEWHKSTAGILWHKENYQKYKELIAVKKEFICENCGDKFESINHGNNKFCSNKCKSAYRRKMKLDDEKRICPVCGVEFFKNKYSKTKTCSKECGRKHSKRYKD